MSSVRLEDGFWQPRREVNRNVSIPSQHHQCVITGRIDNFRRAAKYPDYVAKSFNGYFFNDSDVYKWLEAAAWDLAGEADFDAERVRMIDEVIADVAASQDADGYIGSYYVIDREKDRLTDFDKHELYCGGHLIQAAIAHHRVTGSTSLLAVAQRFADWMCRTIGPAEQGKKPFIDGHEQVEMALIELYRVVGDKRYLELAQWFIDARGRSTMKCGNVTPWHFQDHVPFRQLHEMVGHAVRAVYYASGATDLLAETGEQAIRDALRKQMQSMAERRSYVSGGIGSRWHGEAFGDDYELPNRAYAETCAAIGSVMWSWRTLLLDGDPSHADRIEWTLYNAVLPGVAFDGRHYFYQNPLEDDGKHRRCEWFGCACCPPNVARLLAQLPGYVFSVGRDGGAVYVHQYWSCSASIALAGTTIPVVMRSSMPWEGDVELRIGAAGSFALMLRIPKWCRQKPLVSVNGERVSSDVMPGTYLAIHRSWEAGDVVKLSLPMTIERVACHPYVTHNAGRLALTRGPILYAIESADHPGVDIRELALPADAPIECEMSSDLAGGVHVLKATAIHRRAEPSVLYRSTVFPETAAPVPLTAIPYFAWGHREAGPMQVWIRCD